MESAFDIGRRAHTHYLIYNGPDMYTREPEAMLYQDLTHGPAARPNNGPSGFHPDQIRTAYGVTKNGSGTIAIVDAYDFATSLADFNAFSSQFNLPQETSATATATTNKVFQVAYASGSKPKADAGWAEEEALDIEWAHAMAPNAKIVLVEAKSAAFSDLFAAVSYASKLSGVTQISMSWGGSEFSGETACESIFSGIKSATLFASTGDQGGSKSYPAVSPNIVAVGGTSLFLDSNNNYSNETGWSGSGGGISAYEAQPNFQKSVLKHQTKRSVPDIAAVADPSTGVAVYDSGAGGWVVVGGTSLSSPLCAGIANAGGAKLMAGELTFIYGHISLFHDVKNGKAGNNSCGIGYDLVTGWGSPKTNGSL